MRKMEIRQKNKSIPLVYPTINAEEPKQTATNAMKGMEWTWWAQWPQVTTQDGLTWPQIPP